MTLMPDRTRSRMMARSNSDKYTHHLKHRPTTWRGRVQALLVQIKINAFRM